jgi:hypothetical protein
MTDSVTPWFPEFDLSREERLAAAAEILLSGMRLMAAERNREKTRKWRASKSASAAVVPLDVKGAQSVHDLAECAIARPPENRGELR